MKKPKRFFANLGCVILLSLILILSQLDHHSVLIARAQDLSTETPVSDEEQADPNIEYYKYIDKRYGFSLLLPTDWFINPATEDKTQAGTLTTISSIYLDSNPQEQSTNATGVKIDIGVILYKKPSNKSLADWVTPNLETQTTVQVNQEAIMVNGMEAIKQTYYEESGHSKSIVFIPDGSNVFFFAIIPVGNITALHSEYRTAEAILQSFSIDLRVSNLEPLQPRESLYGSESRPSDMMSVQAPLGYRLPFSSYWYITAGPGCYYTHQGIHLESIDFGVTVNTRILAVQTGTIVYAAYDASYGNRIKILHSDGNESWYGHLSSFGKTSGTVSAGQFIGLSGNTGNVSGPHLHLEVVNSQQSVWIRDVPGISWYSGSAANPCYGNEVDFDGIAYGTPETSSDTIPPQITFNVPTQARWYNTDQTLSWTVSDSGGSGVDYFKWEWGDSTPDNPVDGTTGSTTLGVPGQGQHTLYVQAWDQAGNDSSVQSRGWYGFDTVAPTVPTTVSPGCSAIHDIWQNTCSDPNFSWSGASDATSGLAGYEYYWGMDPAATTGTWTTSAAFDPGAVSDGSYYLRLRAKDNAGNWSNWATLFTLRYDGTSPNGLFTVNDNDTVSRTTQVYIRNSVSDALSGISGMRIRNAGANWGDWQTFNESVPHLLPAITGQNYSVEMEYRDGAGNISPTCSQSIMLDIYPAPPSSASYRLLRSTLGASPWDRQTPSYRLRGTLAPQAIPGQMLSTNYQVSSGYWTEISASQDITPPTIVSIAQANSNPTGASSVDFTITFSEHVTGVDMGAPFSDFDLISTGVTDASIAGISVSGSIYTVTVDTGTGSGTIQLDVPATASILDLANNQLGELPFSSQPYIVDRTAPMVLSVARGGGDPTSASSVDFVVTFSELVSGVDAGDFVLAASNLTGAAITNVVGSGSTYTVTVDPGSSTAGNGTIQL
ncbi:MAG: M23 family metallopeptidase, partial [Anaerolineales bacterium]